MHSGMALLRWTALSWLRARVASITKITAGCGATITTSIPEGFDFGRPQAQAPDLQKRIVRPFKLGLSYSHARRVDTAPRTTYKPAPILALWRIAIQMVLNERSSEVLKESRKLRWPIDKEEKAFFCMF
ncbi:hypothetical protein ALC57_10272 [Trachymyrmex cornetzi]|uniref:Uncharacterized protein n=1 Tax=Trachymyrmex cornetzi TaxID=471704 RepID=A0A195DX56_9HYME|nr:hypothetical protein ALC57_10272 [Trachymyrmex cornetzi]